MEAEIIKYGALQQQLHVTDEKVLRNATPLPSLLALSWYVSFHAARLEGVPWALQDTTPVFTEEGAMDRFFKVGSKTPPPSRKGRWWDCTNPRAVFSVPPTEGSARIEMQLLPTKDLRVGCRAVLPGQHNTDAEMVLLWEDLAEALRSTYATDPDNVVVSYARQLGDFLYFHFLPAIAHDLMGIRKRIPLAVASEGGMRALEEHLDGVSAGFRGINYWGKCTALAIQEYDMGQMEGGDKLLASLRDRRKKLLLEHGVLL